MCPRRHDAVEANSISIIIIIIASSRSSGSSCSTGSAVTKIPGESKMIEI